MDTNPHTLNVETPGVCIECVGHVIVHSQGRAPTSGSLCKRERECWRERATAYTYPTHNNNGTQTHTLKKNTEPWASC